MIDQITAGSTIRYPIRSPTGIGSDKGIRPTIFLRSHINKKRNFLLYGQKKIALERSLEAESS